jgi:hypothetical protein
MGEPFFRQLRAAFLRDSPSLRSRPIVSELRGFGRQLWSALRRSSPAFTVGPAGDKLSAPAVRWLPVFPVPAFSGVRAPDSTRLSTEVLLPLEAATGLGIARVVTVAVEGAEATVVARKVPADVPLHLSAALGVEDEPDVVVTLTESAGWLRGVTRWTSPEPPARLRLGRTE